MELLYKFKYRTKGSSNTCIQPLAIGVVMTTLKGITMITLKIYIQKSGLSPKLLEEW